MNTITHKLNDRCNCENCQCTNCQCGVCQCARCDCAATGVCTCGENCNCGKR